MKIKTLGSSIAVLLLLVGGFTAKAQPTMQDNGATIEGSPSRNPPSGYSAKYAVLSSSVTVTTLPSFGPPKYAGSFQGYASNAVASIISTGTLPVGTMSSPTDARLLGQIAPEDFMTTTSTPFWQGTFNPSAPFDNERGGLVWFWYVVSSGSGDSISLADVVAVLSSSDAGNIMGLTVSFDPSTSSYSPLSPGIRADGSMVTSGQSSVLVSKVIVGVGSKSFDVSQTSDPTNGKYSPQDIRNYLQGFTNWKINSIASAKGVSGSTSLGASLPQLTSMLIGSQFGVIAEANGDPNTYSLQSSPTLGSSAVWSSAGTIRAGQTNLLTSVTNGPSIFVRYAPSIAPH